MTHLPNETKQTVIDQGKDFIRQALAIFYKALPVISMFSKPEDLNQKKGLAKGIVNRIAKIEAILES